MNSQSRFHDVALFFYFCIFEFKCIDFAFEASFWRFILDFMLMDKGYVLYSLSTDFELNTLRMLKVVDRSSLFHQQRPPVWFNWMQIKATDTLHLNKCYTAETSPVVH